MLRIPALSGTGRPPSAHAADATARPGLTSGRAQSAGSSGTKFRWGVRAWKTPAIALVTCIAIFPAAGCKIVKNETASDKQSADEAPTRVEMTVDELWQPKILPFFDATDTDLVDALPGIRGGLDSAGASFGRRAGGEGTPWTFVTQFEGTIVEASTESRAATAGLDVNGDGKIDATLQLGPVIRGTALRDSLPFISFSEFKDQIEFAGLSRALHGRVYSEVLETLPKEALVGKTVGGVGAFAMRGQDEEILITPVEIEVRPAP